MVVETKTVKKIFVRKNGLLVDETFDTEFQVKCYIVSELKKNKNDSFSFTDSSVVEWEDKQENLEMVLCH